MTQQAMSPADFYRSLPRKRMGSGCLLFNEASDLLLVKPNYKDTWEIPGGIVEDDESPRACCVREVKEELGIEIDVQRLLVVDYNTYPGMTDRTESLMFIFDGGIVAADQIDLDMNDHDAFTFVAVDQLQGKLASSLYKRVMLAITQRERGMAVYSEDQVL